MRGTAADELPFRIATGSFALLLIALVCAIVAGLVQAALPSVRQFGFSFWQTATWDAAAGQFGAWPFVWGTLYSSVLALLVASPAAIGLAVFMIEFCPPAFRSAFVFLIELLAAIPSIVYGLWGLVVLVPAVRSVEQSMPEALRAMPLFSGAPLGFGMLAAGLILAMMIAPFVASVSREVLTSVPAAQRDGAYALGATRFEAVRATLFYARSALAGAIVLGFGRALGETMAVAMVIGNVARASTSMFAPQSSMTTVLVNEFTGAAGDRHVSALVEIGLLLFAITLIVNSVARTLIWGMKRSTGSTARTWTFGVRS